jgi:hypothetical protein
MRYLKKYEAIKLVADKEDELTPLEKEFGIKLNTSRSRFLSDGETFYDIFNDDEKVGYVVMSKDAYDMYEFEDELGAAVYYIKYIRMGQSGHLREVVNQLKDIYEEKADYLILEIEASNLQTYKDLLAKYKAVGFEPIIPDTIAEFGIEVADGIDLYSDPVFMMLKLF